MPVTSHRLIASPESLFRPGGYGVDRRDGETWSAAACAARAKPEEREFSDPDLSDSEAS